MRPLSAFLFLVVVLTASPAWPLDDDLRPVTDALAHVRASKGANRMRDAGPELTPVKRALRTWLEHKLPAEPASTGPNQPIYLPSPSDMASLSERLNEELEAAGLTCGEMSSATYRCGGDLSGQSNMRGYLGKVRVSSLDYGRYMLIVTGVGISCGFDESAYIYRRGAGRKWTLLLESEQDDYAEHKYAPQNFLSIGVSPSGVAWNKPAAPPLVLTLGYSPWCSSNWNRLSTRLWRASDSTSMPSALVDRTDTLYLGADRIASARLTEKDFLIEFSGRSIDDGTLIRSHVLHYLIGKGDKLERVAPVALSPNDFVEEWLTSAWSESERWIDAPGNTSGFAKLHSTLAKAFGEFDGLPKRCRSDRTLWQVVFANNEDPKGYRLGPPSYFLVRWTAPYRFSLVRVDQHPFAGCDEMVAMPDDIGTLFPIQGWTP